MCAECNMTPCHPRCPNAPEPKPVCKCVRCKDDLFPGEKYLESTEGVICENCLDNFITSDWLKLFDESLTEAKEDDDYGW